MTATRASIRSALWTALSGLLPGTPTTGVDGCLYTTDDTTSTRPLRSLHRYAGEVSRFAESGREKGVAHTIAGQFPAAFLAFESSMPTGSDGAYVETLAGDIEVTRRIVWSIFVAVNDSTGDGAAESIADDVCERIEGALAGLSIEGLAHGRGVRWLGTVPWVIARRASYVYRLRFSTDADLPEATDALPGNPMSRLDATEQHERADVDARTIDLSASRTTI
jgi:hypothetical protein